MLRYSAAAVYCGHDVLFRGFVLTKEWHSWMSRTRTGCLIRWQICS